MAHHSSQGLNRRQMVLSMIGAVSATAICQPLLMRRAWAAAEIVRYHFTRTGAGKNSGSDWNNALRLEVLPQLLAEARPGGMFLIAADSRAPSVIAIDEKQLAVKVAGASGSPIVLDASGAGDEQVPQAVFQSGKPWSIEDFSRKKKASAYIALTEGASYIEIRGFRVKGTSADGLVKFRGGKSGPKEFSNVTIANVDATDVGRLIETDKQAFLKNIQIENCRAVGIVRGFARFYNLANADFRNLHLDAKNFDAGGKSICQLISINNGENLLFEDVTLKNAVNARFKDDGSVGYFQGDGIVCERGTKNVTIRRCHGSGMGDAAFDLKTTNVTIEESSSESCKFGARIWSQSDNVIRRCAFRNPVKYGNTKGSCVQASGSLTIEDSILEARGDGAALTLHQLKTGPAPHVVMRGGEVTLHDGAPLARSTQAGSLELHDVKVNGTLRSGRFDLDRNEIS